MTSQNIPFKIQNDPVLSEQIYQNSPINITILNEHGLILDINNMHKNRTKDYAVGQNILDFYLSEEKEFMQQRIQRVSSTGQTENYAYTYFSKAENRHIEYYCSLTASNPAPSKILILYSLDISYSGQAENALKNTEAKYRYIVEAATDGIITINSFMKIVDINSSALRLFDEEESNIQGRSLFNFLQLQHFPELPSIFEKLREGQTVHQEFHIETKNKKEIVIDAKISLLPNGNFILLLYDVTYKLHQESLAEQTKSKIQQYKRLESLGVLAGGMAHEFNNILTPIMGYSEILFSELKDNIPLQKNIAQILSGAQRAKELVEQILVFSRKDNKEKHKLDIHIVVKESIKLLRSSTPKHINLKTHIENCSSIEANPSQIQQVIIQLCSNAFNAITKSRGSVEITLKNVIVEKQESLQLPAGKYVLLKISDSGKGIDQSIIDRVFDPFFTTNEIGEGSGMGLSIVHGIIQSHGGTIFIDSEVNKGTTFTIFFPFPPDSATKSIKIKSDLGSKAIQSNIEILIVDDEKEVVNLFEILLNRKGFKVTKFINPLEALEFIKQNPTKFGLIITDQTMPDLIGTELSKEIRTINSSLPVLLLTGFSDLLQPEEFEEHNIADVLIKPVSPQTFYSRIDDILKSNKS